MERGSKGVSPLIRLSPNRTFALVYTLSRVARTAQMGRTGHWSKGLVNTLLEAEYCEHSDIKGWVVVRWQEKKDQMNSPSTS